MSRWHAPSCKTPDILIVDGHNVSCRSCTKSCPPVQELVAQGSAAQHSIPSDKPLGQLNLRWPPSVPYIRWKDSRDSVAPELCSEAADVAKDSGIGEDPADVYHRPDSHVYHELRTGEFRLICLPAAVDRDSVIHLELETVSFDDCPEYETTSYCWGGEDGDSSPCYPIYVGEYYDVLLQTNNCGSMLQYLRPRRGVRMVWIDAICINQQDVREREVQVAQMRAIYQSGRRVVVYLGPAMVYDCNNKRYRSRSWLHKFGPSTGTNSVTFQQVLSHRYFSRLWVIQELLLSSSLLVPIRDEDFLADNTSSQQIDISWDRTKAPWFQHIASRRTFSKDLLLTVLRQTGTSEATDPRDKIFGILGLVDTTSDPAGDWNGGLETIHYPLIPDYSLSTLETFIGITAYMMTTLGHWQLLENAAGVNAIPGYPKWIPDYRQPSMWHNKFAADDGDFGRLFEWYVAQRWFGSSVWNLGPSWKTIDACSRQLHEEIRYVIMGISSGSDPIYSKFQRWREIIWNGDSVPDGLHVDPSTAALSIKLVRILHLTSSPVLVADLGSLRVFEFSKASYSILVCTGQVALDELLGTGPVWLYLRDIDDSSSRNPGTILFLREAQQGQQNDSYDLVCSCACWDLWICRKPKNSEERQSRELPGGSSLNDVNSPPHDCSSGDSYTNGPISDKRGPRAYEWNSFLYETPYATISLLRSSYGLDSTVEDTIRRTFPSDGTRVRDVLPVLQYIIDMYQSDDPLVAVRALSALDFRHFGEFYLSTLRKISTNLSCSLESPCEEDNWIGYRPKLFRNDRIFLTFEPSEWAEVSQYFAPRDSGVFTNRESAQQYYEIWVNWRTVPTERSANKNEQSHESSHDSWVGWQTIHEAAFSRQDDYAWINGLEGRDKIRTVYVYMYLTDVVKLLVNTHLFTLLRNLTKFRPLTNEDESTMVHEMKEEYRGIYWHDWPESLAAELELDGTPQRVQLV
ncbi:heterokaryon incompatibility protein-domain-containing protein [Hypoxylon rubiginosum]|uniref:Heterokaryon incompatibility protein-domain-containing protein n=1 Tax=Hypoxylon rubiginosum TaxID=110542 RepID=A0ACB9YZJ0_9PEZI|nr:heterokaryon incompatibility protein-domain-containing protein [Hypoxylon rubiginosum]